MEFRNLTGDASRLTENLMRNKMAELCRDEKLSKQFTLSVTCVIDAIAVTES